MPVTHTIAYYDPELIIEKRFIVQAKRSPLQRFIVNYVPSIDLKYRTRGKVTDGDKHSSLLDTELIIGVKSFKIQAIVESFTELDSTGKIPVLFTNIRLGWK